MVRNYKRKTCDSYYRESLLMAIQKVKNKEMSAYKAASFFGIPRSTITTRMKNKRCLLTEIRGRPTVFTSCLERDMAVVLHSMERCGFCLTKKEVLGLVSHYVTRNNITTAFKNNLPGQDWFRGFTKRHDLVLKKFRPIESSRKADPVVIYRFYDLLEKALYQLNIPSNRIYSFTETTFNVTRDTVDIQSYSCSKVSKDGHNATVLLGANAYGEKCPPLIISKETVLWNSWIYSKGQTSPKSRINSRVFENYFENFIFSKLCTNNEPLLIIYDGHSTHLDIHVLKQAAKHNITVIKVPPNTTYIQSLDSVIRNVIKNIFEKHLMNRKHNVEKLPDDDFSCITTQSWNEVDPDLLANSFRKAGIWPVDRDQFPREIFDRTALENWELNAQNETKVTIEPFLLKRELLDEDISDDVGSNRENTTESNNYDVKANADKDIVVCNETDIDTNIEFEPSDEEMTSHIEITKTSQSTNADPLSNTSLFDGFSDLTLAIKNLCGELVSVRNEMSSFKKELVKMTSTMTEFNKRIASVENKLPV